MPSHKDISASSVRDGENSTLQGDGKTLRAERNRAQATEKDEVF
jgi:hypothetical protein